MKLSIYKVFKGNQKLNQKKIYIWGSGSGYSRWKEKIDFHAEAIIDNNRKLWGSKKDGIPIVPPDILKDVDKDSTIIFILSFFYEEIKQQVTYYGINELNIYSFKDLERTLFMQEKRNRQKVFKSQNKLSLQNYMGSLEEDLKDINYRNVQMLPVMIPYIALLTNYLFLVESNSNLFPVPGKKEYYIVGNGPILVSFVWHEKRRPSLHDLIHKSISEIQSEYITELMPKSFYDEDDERKTISFMNDSIPINIREMILKLRKRISQHKYCLLKDEVDWFIDFTQFFIRMIDHIYTFFENGNYQIFVSGFPNNSEDNIKIQIAKNLGIKTYGLQHGTYGKKYEFNLVPFSHVYKYPTVDTQLVWGEYSKEILEEIKLDNSEIIAVGNPRYNLTKIDREIIKKGKNKFINRKVFLISFAGPGEREFLINQELLTFADLLADSFKLKYIIKMHPENKVLLKEFNYDKNNCIKFIPGNIDINDCFNEIDFMITTSSIVIHEAVYLYIPVFVYNIHHAVKSICGSLSTVFNNSHELEKMCMSCTNAEFYHNLLNEYETLGNKYFKDYNTKCPTTVYKDTIIHEMKK